jgi:type II secretory pathway pseudopilin PulG
MITSGAAHLFLATRTHRVPTNITPKVAKATKLFQTLYAVAIVAVAFAFTIALIYPLIATIFGIDRFTLSDILSTVILSATALALLAVFLVYHLRLSSGPYAIIMSTFTVIFLVLFAIFPAAALRYAAHDDALLDDLRSIESAVDTYTQDHRQLPDSLDQLSDLDLQNPISTYSYSPDGQSTSLSNTLGYQLCADGFKTDDLDGSDNPVVIRSHNAGTTCYDLGVYLHYSPLDSDVVFPGESFPVYD